EPIVAPIQVSKVFTVTESTVTNGQSIYFDLPSTDTYILVLTDKESGQVISKEKFSGKKGENVKKIFTNSIPGKYLYLTLIDNNNTQINKTIININKL
ncbi:MAG: hypothetical protein RIQ70_465, partial [Bacteroidota bacterium]